MKNYEDTDRLVLTMERFVTYGRITGALFVIAFVIDILSKNLQ
jgi:hypothetical protein